MNEEKNNPTILDDEALKIYGEPDTVIFQTPAGSLIIPLRDWKRILKKLKKL